MDRNDNVQYKRLYGLILLGTVLSLLGGLGGTAVQNNSDHLNATSLASTSFALMDFGGLLIFLISLGWLIIKLVRS